VRRSQTQKLFLASVIDKFKDNSDRAMQVKLNAVDLAIGSWMTGDGAGLIDLCDLFLMRGNEFKPREIRAA